MNRFLLFAALLPLLAFAQTPPAPPRDSAAQEILRQQERERILRERQEQTPDVRLDRKVPDAAERLPEKETPCFVIRKIELVGERAEDFQWALKAADPTDDPATGRCLGSAGVNLSIKRIQNYLLEKAYVTTRVLASPQNLSKGTLTLTLIPGKVRHIRFTQDSDSRASQWNVVPIRTGDTLDLRDMEQALENIKRVPTIEADIKIVPAEGTGVQPGESDLLIHWKQARPFRLNASLDDSGSKATGKYQASGTFSADNWLMLHDLFYFNYAHNIGGGGAPGNKGTRSHLIHYEIPYDYWLLGFTSSYYTYHQTIPGINQHYQYSGNSRNNDVTLTRLFYRDASRKSSAFVKIWERSSANYIDDTEIEIQTRRMAGWEMGFTHKEFIGSAALEAHAAYHRGTGVFQSRHAPEEAYDEGTSRPKIVTAHVQANIPFALLGQRFTYTGNWRRQWNHTPLVPQDRFSIGNRYTVRGFDGELTLMGDRGWLVRNDLALALGNTGQQLYIGVDYGEVQGQSTRWIQGRYLAGAAIGVRGGYKGFYWDAFASTPLNKPEGFPTQNVYAGFSVGWSY